MLFGDMPASPNEPRQPRVPAKWANLPRRKCDNCGTSYKPSRPLRAIDKYGFCKADCKKSFHKNGGAYRKLKGEVQKMVKREINELAEQVRKLMEPILDDAVVNIIRRELRDATRFDDAVDDLVIRLDWLTKFNRFSASQSQPQR